jgi:ABC-type glucose/galactose transport system permease subunit
MKMTKTLLLLILGVFLTASAAAQPASGSWKVISSKNNVTGYYQSGICSGDSVIFLRFVNSGSIDVSISWTLWANDSVEKNTYLVAANQDNSGTCPPAGTGRSTSVLVIYFPAGKTRADFQPSIVIP